MPSLLASNCARPAAALRELATALGLRPLSVNFERTPSAISAEDAAMSAKDAAMGAKDAGMIAKHATMCANEAIKTRQ